MATSTSSALTTTVDISTNEFGNSSGAYNGVIIYAISKELLETEAQTGIPATVFAYRVTSDQFGAGPYHIAPAETPPGARFAPNTEYFVEFELEPEQRRPPARLCDD